MCSLCTSCSPPAGFSPSVGTAAATPGTLDSGSVTVNKTALSVQVAGAVGWQYFNAGTTQYLIKGLGTSAMQSIEIARPPFGDNWVYMKGAGETHYWVQIENGAVGAQWPILLPPDVAPALPSFDEPHVNTFLGAHAPDGGYLSMLCNNINSDSFS